MYEFKHHIKVEDQFSNLGAEAEPLEKEDDSSVKGV